MMDEERNDSPEIEPEPMIDSDIAEAEQSATEADLDVDAELEIEEEPEATLDAADIDVEQALAAVASLHQLVQQGDEETQESFLDDDAEEFEIAEFRRVPAEEQDTRDEVAPPIYSDFPRPPVSMLVRGQAASVIPALLLIVIGAVLTFLLTTTDLVLSPAYVIGGALGIVGIALIAYWFSSGRWANGAFFAGTLLLTTGGTALWLLLTDTPGWLQGYPLLLTATGIALVLTDLFSPSSVRVWAGGLILAVAGVAGTAVTSGVLQLSLLQLASGLLPVALGIVALLLVAPLLQRRRR